MSDTGEIWMNVAQRELASLRAELEKVEEMYRLVSEDRDQAFTELSATRSETRREVLAQVDAAIENVVASSERLGETPEDEVWEDGILAVRSAIRALATPAPNVRTVKTTRGEPLKFDPDEEPCAKCGGSRITHTYRDGLILECPARATPPKDADAPRKDSPEGKG